MMSATRDEQQQADDAARRAQAFSGGSPQDELRPLRLDAGPFASIAHVQRLLSELQGLFGVEYVEVERILGPAVRFRLAYRGLVPFDRRLRDLDAIRWQLVRADDHHIEIELARIDGQSPGAPTHPAAPRPPSAQ